MKDAKQINSVQNPLVKRVLTLKDKSRERRKTGFFVLEGQQEVQLAIKGKFELETLFINPGVCNNEAFLKALDNIRPRPEFIIISNEIYKKLAYRESTEGILAIAKGKSHTLDNLVFRTENPFILIAEAPEKPGNIGALLRTADAANLDAVIIADPKTDLYNPNIIRSSVGSIFTNQIAMASTSEAIEFLRKENISILCAALTASKIYTHVDFTKPSALVVGTEATGLSNKWLEHSHQNILIPMAGQIDSLNVSVSAAILIFEGLRQRGF